jgi:hypothetical protein
MFNPAFGQKKLLMLHLIHRDNLPVVIENNESGT